MTKFNRIKPREVEDWVAENGLVEYGGATKTSLCEHFGISLQTLERWSKGVQNVEFVESIKKGRERFKSQMEENLVKSLAKAASGHKETERRKIIEPDPNNPQKGQLVREEIHERYFPPQTASAIFLLTNIAPER